jgi:hypothetical protein
LGLWKPTHPQTPRRRDIEKPAARGLVLSGLQSARAVVSAGRCRLLLCGMPETSRPRAPEGQHDLALALHCRRSKPQPAFQQVAQGG